MASKYELIRKLADSLEALEAAIALVEEINSTCQWAIPRSLIEPCMERSESTLYGAKWILKNALELSSKA